MARESLNVGDPSKENAGVECSKHREMRNAIQYWSDILKGRNNSEDLGVDGMIILKGT